MDLGVGMGGGGAWAALAWVLLSLLPGAARADGLGAAQAASQVTKASQSKLLEQQDEALAEEAARLGILSAIEGGRTTLPRQARRMAVALVREARRHGLDPRLVAAVAEVESHFDPLAVSSQGALGLMQVMPATARWLGGLAKRPLRDRELFDVELNLLVGTGYLAQLLAEFSTVEEALLAYNAGPTGARKLVAAGIRPALAAYPKRVLEVYRRLSATDDEAATSAPPPPAAPPAAPAPVPTSGSSRSGAGG
ncbi:MAG: lytic transglycosylase domain-containing protein [Myxococcales bacterium]